MLDHGVTAIQTYFPEELIAYGPHKTLYNRWKRWSEAGVFIRMMEGLSGAQAERRTLMIDATYLKAHRTASSLAVKKGVLGGSSDAPKAA